MRENGYGGNELYGLLLEPCRGAGMEAAGRPIAQGEKRMVASQR